MVEYGNGQSGPERRLEKIEDCIKRKVSMKLVMWLFGGLSLFTVVIIGGAQWTIIDRIGKIETHTAVMAISISQAKIVLNNHRLATDQHEIRIRQLEKREASRHPEYFQWHDRQVDK